MDEKSTRKKIQTPPPVHSFEKPQMPPLITKLSPPPLSLFTIISIFFFLTHNHGRRHLIAAAAANIFIYSGCSTDKYQPNSLYETNLNSLLSSIAASSSHSLYNSFTVGNDTTFFTDSPTAAYGLYQCRGDLKPRDCSTCIASLISQIELLCPFTYGANIQLDGCFLRYEDSDFLGKTDDSLRFKKCSGGGGGGGGGAEFVRRRDGVLAYLQGAAAGGFGVSAAGLVEGYAQCLGDLAAEECGECLSDAAAEVRSLCGAAAAGDVFLAQCYVRYWESGHYDSPSDSSNQDDLGKPVAIIVGVVGGVAVLIILLAFCRKALG